MKKMYIYHKKHRNLIGATSGCQTLEGYYHHIPEMLEEHGSIYSNIDIEDYRSYKIINDNMVKMSSLERQEVKLHGKLLSSEERLIESLKPSIKEVQKAESEIEILTLLNEVDVI